MQKVPKAETPRVTLSPIAKKSINSLATASNKAANLSSAAIAQLASCAQSVGNSRKFKPLHRNKSLSAFVSRSVNAAAIVTDTLIISGLQILATSEEVGVRLAHHGTHTVFVFILQGSREIFTSKATNQFLININRTFQHWELTQAMRLQTHGHWFEIRQ